MDNLVSALPRTNTLAAQVAEKLENLIVEGLLQQGEKLPSERELAEKFSVSRTVIREAVRSLMAKSLLEVKPGSGTHIRAPSQQYVTQSMVSFLRVGREEIDYAKVHEVRRVLETEIAGLASSRRSDEDLAVLRALVEEMPTLRNDREALAVNDVAFHAALAAATGNEMFAILLDSIADVMFSVRKHGLRLEHAADNAIDYHTRLFALVEAGDADAARTLMLEHLRDSEAIFREAVQRSDSAADYRTGTAAADPVAPSTDASTALHGRTRKPSRKGKKQ